jgi:hypothetical protein
MTHAEFHNQARGEELIGRNRQEIQDQRCDPIFNTVANLHPILLRIFSNKS